MKLMFGYSCRVRSDERLILSEALASYGELQKQLILLSFNYGYAEIWSESKLAALRARHEVGSRDR
ncbi:hypothetical protein C9993_10325 [Marinobacter sp. Z-F4-2]|nr:hypothetical protein C9993_10325 [Marinobacter sp. Z-F4-2]